MVVKKQLRRKDGPPALYTAQQNSDGTVSVSQTKLSDEQYNQARGELQKMDANGYKPDDKKKDH